jgi:hypothetical protein
MKRSDQDRLLREILGDGDAASFRAASLARGVEFLQRRRRRHRLALVCAAAIVPALLIYCLVPHPAIQPAFAPPVIRRASATQADTDKVKIITDEELFALFPNRPMALIGPPGRQQLVFLDHGVASEHP